MVSKTYFRVHKSWKTLHILSNPSGNSRKILYHKTNTGKCFRQQRFTMTNNLLCTYYNFLREINQIRLNKKR